MMLIAVGGPGRGDCQVGRYDASLHLLPDTVSDSLATSLVRNAG
jgi:hypothetical protein